MNQEVRNSAAAAPLAPSPVFDAPYAQSDEVLVPELLEKAALPAGAEEAVNGRARRFIEAIRAGSGLVGGVEDFLHEYGLTTREGLALMVLAEALLRVPDAATQDALIEDKLGEGRWGQNDARAQTWFVSAATWGLGIAARIIQPGETPKSILGDTVKRMGMPTIRKATRRAMEFMGHQFVLGQTIAEAQDRAKSAVARGFRYSYDMLGEGARTSADAARYLKSYADAIDAIGAAAGDGELPARPGISVKLSALHPRYEATNRDAVLADLVPELIELAKKAKSYNLNFTVDAEEADRLELSLDVIAATFADPSLRGWDGFGLAIQAYQKRAIHVVEWADRLAETHGGRMMVRLVKGAYWDGEIKHAQIEGVDDYPVFTRKAATDVSYLACARRLLDARPRLYPQFATHNALTVASVLSMAGNGEGFEFQRLHGMGEDLYDHVTPVEGVACRIYAPVGGHRELLAYLVRRLLENGANSSFVAVVRDPSVPVEQLLRHPADELREADSFRHPNIPLPRDIYKSRPNSRGVEFGHGESVESLTSGMADADPAGLRATTLINGEAIAGEPQQVTSPIDGREIGVQERLDPADALAAMDAALAGFPAWATTPVPERAAILERAADLLEAERDPMMALLSREGGKTLPDGISEVREAADFCRYYAAQIRERFAEPQVMPGPTGEENTLRMRGRGPFVCISPWNFPLAIFMGQVVAALAAGNTVVAKPAEQTSLIAYETVRLLHRAGVPKTALHLVLGRGSRIGPALLAHPRLAGVAFTGSTETAWLINRQLAAKDGPIVPFIAETGGLNAMIVDATALPEQVTDDVIASAFRSAGQRCSALRILFLQEDVADGMLNMIEGAARELALGDPARPETDIGPVIDEPARDGLLDHVRAMDAAGKVRYAGDVPDHGSFVAPHIIELGDAGELDAEHFGPILHVVRWKAGELEAAVKAVNASGYGLTFGLHSRIGETLERVVRDLNVGNIYVNRTTIGAVVGTQPFGGAGLSGTGPKAGGPNYLTRFAQEQVVSVNTAAAGGNASLIAMAGDG